MQVCKLAGKECHAGTEGSVRSPACLSVVGVFLSSKESILKQRCGLLYFEKVI